MNSKLFLACSRSFLHAPAKRIIRVVAVLSLLAVSLLLKGGLNHATAAPSGTSITWSIVPSPNLPNSGSNELRAVAAISDDDVWAVGNYYSYNINAYQTLIQHWDGTQWSIVSSPNVGTRDNELSGIAVVASNDIWAVGSHEPYYHAQTLIEHWDGTSWSVVPRPNASSVINQLNAVAVVSGDNVWAVGDYNDTGFRYDVRTLILHWDGTNWNVVTHPATVGGSLDALAVVSANDIWAAGDVILHWDGTTWSPAPPAWPGGEGPPVFHSIGVVSANDLWAVGEYERTPIVYAPVIEHWDGTGWSLVPVPSSGKFGSGYFYAVGAVSAGDVWAMGAEVVHWDGAGWSLVASPGAGLKGISLLAADDIWAVGGYTQTVTQHGHIPTTAPAQPRLNSPGNGETITRHKVNLYWYGVNDAAYYKLVVRQDSNSGSKVVRLANLIPWRFELDNLVSGKTYYWHVQACNAIGCSDWSRWRSFTVQ